MEDGSFSADEMLAIREQYEERIAQAEQRREELEWAVRMELAHLRVRDLSPQRAVDEIRRVEATLRAVLEPTEMAPAEPIKAAPPPLPLPRPVARPISASGSIGRGRASASISGTIAPPPPSTRLPSVARNPSSRLESFARAMGRKITAV